MLGLAAIAVGGLLRLRPFRVEVRGESMRPTLEPGDWCVATARGRVKKGDVVVVHRPDRPDLEVVKRVTAAPGEEGEWFVQGDNAKASTDSRHFGSVSRASILGKVRLVYWPPRRFRLL